MYARIMQRDYVIYVSHNQRKEQEASSIVWDQSTEQRRPLQFQTKKKLNGRRKVEPHFRRNRTHLVKAPGRLIYGEVSVSHSQPWGARPRVRGSISVITSSPLPCCVGPGPRSHCRCPCRCRCRRWRGGGETGARRGRGEGARLSGRPGSGSSCNPTPGPRTRHRSLSPARRPSMVTATDAFRSAAGAGGGFRR